MRDTYTTRARVIERHERAVVISHGMPPRPVIVPLANVDLEPDSFEAGINLPGHGEYYVLTTSWQHAREIGLTV